MEKFKNLEFLFISNNISSDLSPLIKLKKLRFIDCHWSSISEEEILEFKKYNPQCQINNWEYLFNYANLECAFLEKPFIPQKVVNVFKYPGHPILSIGKPIYISYYDIKVRHYTLERHTLLVMNEFERHFSQIDLPTNKNLFRLMLALHDIGKPKAFLEGNKNNQYTYTTEIINGLRNSLPFSNLEVDLCISLVSTDTLGKYLQGQINLETAKTHIITLARRTNLSILAFFKLMTVYYQCDIASYTADAGGLAYLEHLFVYQNSSKVFDKANNRLKFSTNFEVKFLELEKSLSL